MRAVLALSAFLLAGNLAVAQPVTDCDRLTANPSDPKAVASGVAFNDIIAVKAIPACEEALRQHQGSPRLQLNLGRAHSRAGASGEAVRWYRLAAEQGYAAGQNSLGIMYTRGQGVTKDDAEAVRWYRLAADQGLADAQRNLGLMYARGQGVTKDDAETVRWYRLAADQGLASAQYNLGGMYEQFRGVPQNLAEAARLYRLAADQGLALAQLRLGTLYENGSGVTRDVEKAAIYYSRAFSGGQKDAMDPLYKLLGSEYLLRTGRIENLFKGYSLLASVGLCRLQIPDALQKKVGVRIDDLLSKGITAEAADEMSRRVYSETRERVQRGICSWFVDEWADFKCNEEQRGLVYVPCPIRLR